jgi:hypothetical protein
MILDMLAHLAWPLFLALPLLAAGAVLTVWGAKRGWRGLHGAVHGDSAQLVPFMQGFRAAVIGLALIGVAIAWVWQIPWLLVLSLATAGGETLETSLILFALRHGARLEIGRPRVRTSGPPSHATSLGLV